MTKFITFIFSVFLCFQVLAGTASDIAYKLVANSPVNPGDRQLSYNTISEKLISLGIDDLNLKEAGELLLDAPIDLKLFLAKNLNIQSASISTNYDHPEVNLDSAVGGLDTMMGGLVMTVDTLLVTTLIIIPASIDAAL